MRSVNNFEVSSVSVAIQLAKHRCTQYRQRLEVRYKDIEFYHAKMRKTYSVREASQNIRIVPTTCMANFR